MLDGTKKDYTVEEEQSVLSLKDMICAISGVPVDQMRLIHGGKMMNDESKIGETGVKAGNTINMVMNLRGWINQEVENIAIIEAKKYFKAL